MVSHACTNTQVERIEPVSTYSPQLHTQQVRAESDSLSKYFLSCTSPSDILALLSFNHWQFTVDALTETAVTLHDLGVGQFIGFWADDLPLRDTGWTTSRRVSRLLNSPAIDTQAYRALIKYGVPRGSFVEPPIRTWKPHPTDTAPLNMVRSEIRKWKYHQAHMGRSILQVHPDTNTPIRDDHQWPRRWVEQAALSYMWVYDQTQQLIRERGVSAIVLYNGRFTHDQAAASAAAALGVKVLYYDAGGMETGFDLTTHSMHDWEQLQDRMMHMASEWDQELVASVGSQWFENRQNHSEPGIELFVGMQEHGYIGELPQAKNLVVFFSSSGDEIAELDLDWNQFFHSQENALFTLSQVCKELEDTKLVVRTHPHMRIKPQRDLQDWNKAVNGASVDFHIGPESTVDSYELMRQADVVVTYGSTSGVEAAYIGKPVLVLGPSAYNKLGCAHEVSDRDHMRELIENPPTPNSSAALAYGLMMQRRGFNFAHLQRNPDGSSNLNGSRIEPASELVRKISHAIALRKTRSLLGDYNRG